METIRYRPIGVVHSPFKKIEGVPIQPAGAKGIRGMVKIFPPFSEGLRDLAGFSHVMLIYHFHLAKNFVLRVKPFLDNRPRGLFATRAPKRPNPIGLSVVRLIRRRGSELWISDVDVVDGTPLLDIKPYVPVFDAPRSPRIGWLRKNVNRTLQARADTRFKK